MQYFEYQEKISNLVEKFTDGIQRYNKQVVFNIVIKQLAEEKDIYTVLDQVLLMHEELADEYKKLGEELMNCKMELTKYKVV